MICSTVVWSLARSKKGSTIIKLFSWQYSRSFKRIQGDAIGFGHLSEIKVAALYFVLLFVFFALSLKSKHKCSQYSKSFLASYPILLT